MIIERYFLSNLHKNLCCGCSLEWPREAILMSTHNIGFYEEIAKLSLNYHQICILSFLLVMCLIGFSSLSDETKNYFYMSSIMRKPVSEIFDQVGHKLGCTATECRKKLEISGLGS